MQITVNGEPREVPANTTVAQLIAALAIEPKHVAVEVNRDIVPRAQHAGHQLGEGDTLEVVTLVGGG